MSILNKSLSTNDLIKSKIIEEDDFVDSKIQGETLILTQKPMDGMFRAEIIINTSLFYEYGIETIKCEKMEDMFSLTIRLGEVNNIQIINDSSNKMVNINGVLKISGPIELENVLINPYFPIHLNLSSNYEWYGLLKNHFELFDGCTSIKKIGKGGIYLNSNDIARTIYGIKQGYSKHQLWDTIYKDLGLKEVPFYNNDNKKPVTIDMNMYDLSLSKVR